MLPSKDPQPTGHNEQALGFISLERYWPSGHDSHAPFFPIPASPASHLVHFKLPFSDFSPTPQELHLEDPSAAAIELARQSSHAALLLEPLFWFFFPAAHLLHSSGLVKPVADEYRPCGHPMQTLLEVAPISVEYNPAEHSVVFLNNRTEKGEEEQKKTK